MPAAKVMTPLWVRAIVVAVLVGAPAWGLVAYQDRVGNQKRLGAIASQIAGRPVRVHCPGVLRRLMVWEMYAGTVRFDATGRPADETRLEMTPCRELDALAEGRRAEVLDCLAAHRACGQAGADLAMAVDVITHESWHLAGHTDEAQTECRALQTMAWTAGRLGVAPAAAQALAEHEYLTGYELLPDRYQSPACADGAAWDLRPQDAVWP
jgi:hypothetical protein